MPAKASSLDGFEVRLDEKVAIITGAASGIGEASAKALADAGAAVVISDVDEDNLGRVEQEIAAAGGQATARVASNASFVGFNESSAYCTTKGAVRNMTLAFAAELAQQGVRVNAFAPGTIDTPMNHFWFADEERLAGVAEAIPAKRIGTVEDLVGAVLYLASDASRWTHGAVIPIEGGWLAV